MAEKINVTKSEKINRRNEVILVRNTYRKKYKSKRRRRRMSHTDKYAELYKPCEHCEQRIVNELTVGSTGKPIFRIKIGMTGFEPATPSSQARCATKLRYIPIIILNFHFVGLAAW